MIGLGLHSCQEYLEQQWPGFCLNMLDAEAFRDACARFPTGVAIATVRAPDGLPHGLTVSSFTSVSLSPPLVLICVDHGCYILPFFRESRFFAVNVLSELQRDLSVTFSVKPEGRFEDVPWAPGIEGQPLIRDALAQIQCHQVDVVAAGDHDIVIGEVRHARSLPGEPLVYFDRNYRTLR